MRAMTKSQWMRLSAVMISSTMSSAKYSCSGSPLMFWNGKTAIDGLSGSEGGRQILLARLPRVQDPGVGTLSGNAGEGEPGPKGRVGERSGIAIDLAGADWPRDILERLLAPVLEGEVEPTRGALLNGCRNADATRLGQAFEPGRDVDPVAENVAVLDDDVAHVDANAELDAPLRWQGAIALGHGRLHLRRAAQRIDDAGELDKEAVAGGFAVIAGDFWDRSARRGPP